MELEENLVPNEGAEIVEETTEQTQVEEVIQEPEKIYSEEDLNKKVDELLSKKIARREAKIRKEYESKYGNVENVLKAGLGVESIEEATTQLSDFYTKKGIKIPATPTYSDRDMEVLARAEADEIISSGFDEVIEEVDRLANIGVDNMTLREREVFKKLAEYRQTTERKKELSSIGVREDVYDSADFKDFASKFNANVPFRDVYELYAKTQPKAKIEPIGSMKTTTQNTNEVKDFYTRDEALKFTKQDFDKNPELFKAVERSMSKW